MVQWYNGTMVQWYNGTMAQWCNVHVSILFIDLQKHVLSCDKTCQATDIKITVCIKDILQQVSELRISLCD